MVLFSSQYGPFRKPKWCFLQCGKMSFEFKLLVFSYLCKPFIIRVFASEGKSDSKYSLIFRGISGKSYRKIRIRLQSVSNPHRIAHSRNKRRLSVSDAAVYVETRPHLNSDESFFRYRTQQYILPRYKNIAQIYYFCIIFLQHRCIYSPPTLQSTEA